MLNNARTPSVDTAVIGAGITGLSIAWHLAAGGAEVLVVDRAGVGAEASGVQPGGVRHQWGTPVNCDLAVESVAFYRDVSDRLDARARPVLETCGYLFVADDDAQLAHLRASVAVQNDAGVASRVVTPDEAEQLVPGLTGASIAGASWCADDGYFDKPQSVVEAFAEAAKREGAGLRIAEVAGLERDGEGWRLRLSDGERLRADQVVVAAGYDAPRITASIGLALPIEKHAKYLFFSDPIRERLLEPLVVASGRRFAAKQLADGRVLASDLEAAGDPGELRETWRRTIQSGVHSLLPVLEHVSYPLLVEGFYDMTPDHQPILGTVDGLDGLWLAVGFSGHGFMMAPAIGRRLAEAIRGGVRHPSIDELSLARFDRTDLVHELQIV